MSENAAGAESPVDDYTLIAYDEDSRAAIVFRGLGGYEPYVACFGYDSEDGTWSQGYYCSDLSDAVGEYDRMRGVEQPFCEVRWYREDVAQFIEERLGLPATDSNIDSCIDQLTMRHGMQDMSISAGWEAMDAIVYESLLPDRAQEERKAGSIRI